MKHRLRGRENDGGNDDEKWTESLREKSINAYVMRNGSDERESGTVFKGEEHPTTLERCHGGLGAIGVLDPLTRVAEPDVDENGSGSDKLLLEGGGERNGCCERVARRKIRIGKMSQGSDPWP